MPPKRQSDYQPSILGGGGGGGVITPSVVGTLPRPGATSPASIKFSPDGAYVTYLVAPDATKLTRRLFALELSSGSTVELFKPNEGEGEEGTFSLEEQLRRERARQMHTGVTSYQWAGGGGDAAAAGGRMLVPLDGSLWLLEGLGSGEGGAGEVRCLIKPGEGPLPDGEPILDPRLSEDGKTVAFVCSAEVYTLSVDEPDATPVQATFGARGSGLTHGLADFLAQEEMDRYEGYWLSHDGSSLAFEEVDDTHITPYRIVHQGDEDVHTFEETRYPFAGGQNPKVRLGVTSSAAPSEEVLWFDLSGPFGDDNYLARVQWLDDGSAVMAQVLDRRQHNLALLKLHVSGPLRGQISVVMKEKAIESGWINLHKMFQPIASNSKFLWASEQDGYRHLYVGDLSVEGEGAGSTQEPSTLLRLTGPGEFIVEDIVKVDEDGGFVYYMGTSPDKWTERHLFRARLDGSDALAPQCLTSEQPGFHSCVVNSAAGGGFIVDSVSNVATPTTVTVYALPAPDGPATDALVTPLHAIHDAAAADPRVLELASSLTPPELVTFPSTDGAVTLQGAIYKPDPAVWGEGPWPCVVATYGGPHVMTITNSWAMTGGDLRSQFLRAQGFCVVKVDNRGSDRRGHVFEVPIRYKMGSVEVDDQVAGVEYAVTEGIADKERVAISGWSYGGYMALTALAKRPDVFHAAVSGAPVTDWRFYDTCYTERYMGLPQENQEGYATSSTLAHLEGIEGSLLLCHGLIDENVLFRNSAMVINGLIAARKKYELLAFPNERHGPRRPGDRAFLEERILAFLQDSLGLR